jgi:hypothetical protein
MVAGGQRWAWMFGLNVWPSILILISSLVAIKRYITNHLYLNKCGGYYS